VGWSWAFGDGATSSSQNPSHSFGAAGTYTVTLTVTDNDGATDATSQEVTVTAPEVGEPGDITLSASGYKVRGRKHADLTWSGATSTNVDVYRDGSLVATVANTGAWTHNANEVGGGSHTYRVCEAGTSTCSNDVTVSY
jgi:serine protease